MFPRCDDVASSCYRPGCLSDNSRLRVLVGKFIELHTYMYRSMEPILLEERQTYWREHALVEHEREMVLSWCAVLQAPL